MNRRGSRKRGGELRGGKDRQRGEEREEERRKGDRGRAFVLSFLSKVNYDFDLQNFSLF